MSEDCWLPNLEYYKDYESWNDYQEVLYAIFKHDFLDTFPFFEGIKVSVKHYPIEYGKEEAFFHTTCKNYNKDSERVPDLRRCERIRWIRAFIENYNCNLNLCSECEGIKVWYEPYKSRTRIHILLEEERYMVVLEQRKGYYLLITAFYLDYDNALEKQLKHYEKYREN